MSESAQYTSYNIWKNYKVLDEEGNVIDLDEKANVNALTNLIQIVRFAYRKNEKLESLLRGYASRLNLYFGQEQRDLTDVQREVMKKIADYIINDGAISPAELNTVDTDLWRSAVVSFKDVTELQSEMDSISKFLLRTA